MNDLFAFVPQLFRLSQNSFVVLPRKWDCAPIITTMDFVRMDAEKSRLKAGSGSLALGSIRLVEANVVSIQDNVARDGGDVAN